MRKVEREVGDPLSPPLSGFVKAHAIRGLNPRFSYHMRPSFRQRPGIQRQLLLLHPHVFVYTYDRWGANSPTSLEVLKKLLPQSAPFGTLSFNTFRQIFNQRPGDLQYEHQKLWRRMRAIEILHHVCSGIIYDNICGLFTRQGRTVVVKLQICNEDFMSAKLYVVENNNFKTSVNKQPTGLYFRA